MAKRGRPRIETTPKSGCYFCEGSGFHLSNTKPCQACNGTGKEIVRKQLQKLYNAENDLPIYDNLNIE